MKYLLGSRYMHGLLYVVFPIAWVNLQNKVNKKM